MLHSLKFRVGGACELTPDEAIVVVPADDERLWVDVESPTTQELELLRSRFDLHPVALDDCNRFDQRPKLEEYKNQLFVVLHRLTDAAATGEISSVELHAFIGENYLITVHEAPLGEVHEVQRRLQHEPELRQRGLVYAYYMLCERLVNGNYALLDRLFEQIEQIEDSVLRREDDDALPELFAAKRRLAASRRMLVPQREIAALLLESGTPFIDERTRPYFRRVLDVLIRITEALDTQREILTNVLDAHLSIVNNRTNAIMKSLTLLSAIFLPLGFVTGFFGQNFEHLPFQSEALMWLGMALCLLIPTAMLLWFRTRHWL